jgi:hypothetical protein
LTLGCVKNRLTHDEAFDLGCKMGKTDGQDQENFVGTGLHLRNFIRGYNEGFAVHDCHRHHDGGASSTTVSASTTAP